MCPVRELTKLSTILKLDSDCDTLKGCWAQCAVRDDQADENSRPLSHLGRHRLPCVHTAGLVGCVRAGSLLHRTTVKKEPRKMNLNEVRNFFWRERRPIVFLGKSRTKQSPREACDANAIVKRWQSTGVIEHVMKTSPRYGDFENVDDYLTSLNRVHQAHDQFDELPAEIRDHCQNDPGVFLAWVENPENASQMAELGLTDLAVQMHGETILRDDPELTTTPAVPSKTAPEKPAAEPGPDAST